MDSLSNVLVICTRNRPNDIKRCLASVNSATNIPNRIIVVDSSDGDETEEYCAEYHRPITYVRAPRGLTVQRNIALAEIEEQVVHFIDDDVEIEPDYFRAILEAFRASPRAAGVGGAVIAAGAGAGAVALGAGASNPKIVARLTLRSSARPGRVLGSGYNTGTYDSPRAIDVDWLPGCSMSFRMDLIQGLRFDERRKGYALGEDVDFGLKALERGPLIYEPSARLIHHLSPTNRADLPKKVRASVHNRWALAADFPHRVSRVLVVYSSIAEGLVLAFKSIKKGRFLQRQMAVAAFAGVIDVLTDGSNVEL